MKWALHYHHSWFLSEIEVTISVCIDSIFQTLTLNFGFLNLDMLLSSLDHSDYVVWPKSDF